jgi:hypothetical protein
MTSGQLDHLVINVGDDLDAAAAWFADQGFVVSERGYHSFGSANHLILVGDHYIELIGVPAPLPSPPTWLVEGARGLKAFALRADDPEALVADLRGKGLRVRDAVRLSRPVDVDGEERLASFDLVQLDVQPCPDMSFFWCRHRTPELVWQDQTPHANGAVRVLGADVTSARAARSTALCADLFGPALAQTLSFIDGEPGQPATIRLETTAASRRVEVPEAIAPLVLEFVSRA